MLILPQHGVRILFIAGLVLKKKKKCEPLTRPMGLNVMATDRQGFRGHHRLPVPVLKNLREMALTAGKMFERGTGLPPKQRQKHGRSKSR
ncbi:unnamed protein product [Macrosiphum euphorbiae]|uniref:Uncharacterized protein n=1 Tax=Macrosiphum euphorbiae TaxID=13131 RepID=A0AAV0Y7M9_9HEMI|nr:unnamed protein product [Macrosiphum euphorbiae]